MLKIFIQFGLLIIFFTTAHAADIFEYKAIKAQTVLSNKLSSFCIQKVQNNFEYEYVQNARGYQGYRCKIFFIAKNKNGSNSQTTKGYREFTFQSTPVIISRDDTLPQNDYIKRNFGDKVVFYKIPLETYNALSGISHPREQRDISRQFKSLAFPISAYEKALKVSCLSAFLESEINYCTDKKSSLPKFNFQLEINTLPNHEEL